MRPTDRDIFEEQCTAYVLGALEPREAQTLEQELAHMGSDAVAFFESMQEVAWMIPLSVAEVLPPPHIKQQLLLEVRRRKQTLAPSAPTPSLLSFFRSLTLAWSTATLLFLATTGLSLLAWQLTQQRTSTQQNLQHAQNTSQKLQQQISTLTQTVTQQHGQLQQQTQRIFALRQELHKKQRLLTLLATQHIEMVRFEVPNKQELKKFVGGYGKLIWNPKTNQALFQLANLPVFSDKDYQLWMLEPGKKLPHKAGVYVYQGDRYNFFPAPVPVPQRKRRLQFAVSLEPKGGSPNPTPTGPIMMLSSRISL